MGFHNWSMKSERTQKKEYISTCRKIVKQMVRSGWLSSPPEGSSWDHMLSCQVANLSHLSLYVVNCPHNLELLTYKANNRKGTRCSQGVEDLIRKYVNWDRRDEFNQFTKSLEIKWGLDFNKLIKPIDVNS